MSVGRRKNDVLDRYDTPAWVTRAFLRAWRKKFDADAAILEPAAGSGLMLDVLRERYPEATFNAIDIEPRRADVGQMDFLNLTAWKVKRGGVRTLEGPDLIITNPPFRLAEQFLRQAMRTVRPGGYVAFLLRAAFLESKRRENLLEQFPPERVYFLRKRPCFTGPNESGSSDASMYAWFVFKEGARPKFFRGLII